MAQISQVHCHSNSAKLTVNVIVYDETKHITLCDVIFHTSLIRHQGVVDSKAHVQPEPRFSVFAEPFATSREKVRSACRRLSLVMLVIDRVAEHRVEMFANSQYEPA